MLTVSNRQRTRRLDLRLLKQLAAALLDDGEGADAALAIILVEAPEMAQLNERFLGHEGPTDVITFEYGSPGGGRPDRRAPLCGDIFICVSQAVSQARTFRTNWQSELVRYLVHGLLHLKGYDDRRAADRRRMKRQEHRHLQRLSRRFSLARLARRDTLGA